MAGKSTGQILGTVVGAAAGFFLPGGYVALGASIGGMAGGLIDPPKGADTFGPRLDDLTVQTSTYGASLGRAYGTVMVSGNLYWLEGDKLYEHVRTESQGGKGGGGSEYTSYTYTATFAVGLLKVSDPTQTVALRRLWVGDILVYDAGSDDIESIIASNSQTSGFTFYNGADNQPANPRMQADDGDPDVSAYPGLVHVDFNDLDMTPYSNTMLRAQVRAEVVVGPAIPHCDELAAVSQPNPSGWIGKYSVMNAVYEDNRVRYTLARENDLNGEVLGVTFVEYEYGAGFKVYSVREENIAGAGYLRAQPTIIRVFQSDRPLALFHADTYNYLERGYLVIYESDAVIEPGFENAGTTNLSLFHTNAVVDGGDMFFAADDAHTEKIIKYVWPNKVAESAGTYRVGHFGYSENYLFLVRYEGGGTSTTTVYKLNRSNLSLAATLVGDCNGYNARIFVVSDTEFFTRSDANCARWIDGDVVDVLVDALPETVISSFYVRTFSPFYALSCDLPTISFTGSFYVSHEKVPSKVAKLRDIVTAECGLAGITPADLDLSSLTNSDVRGFKVADPGSVRAPLEQLQAAFAFDVMQSGYAVRFVSRGATSGASIPEGDLAAAAGGEQRPVLLPIQREMDSQIAARVKVRHLDPNREYNVGEQYAERPSTASVSERIVDLAIVFTAAEAAQVADILNQKDWIERRDFGPFSLPPTWRHLEPADVITLAHRGQAYSLRLTRVEYLPDGRLSCMARQTSSACYTSTATGEESGTGGQTLVPLRGSTTGYLLDIPRIRAEQDTVGMCFGLLGMASGWPGAGLLRSDDSGTTWATVGAMTVRADVFTADSPLAAHHGYSPDWSGRLSLTPLTPGAELYAVSEEQCYSQANLAAYGADGRWELVSFREVVDHTGSYTVSWFMRGLYGSEWASGLHQAGDLFILLDTSKVGFFGLPTNALGSPRIYRAVTQGAAIAAADDVVDTYEAVNLKPLSPVDMKGWIDAVTNDWAITAVARSRHPVEVFSGFEVPESESVESWVFEIYDSGAFDTLVRTVASPSASFSYTAAQQVADLGATVTTVHVRACRVSSTVGRGFWLAASLTAPTLPDPYLHLVTSLLHFEGANGSTTITDKISGNVWTVAGNAQLTTSAPLYGSSSLLTDSATDYVYANAGSNFTFGLGDFTIEFSYTPTSLAAIAVLVDFRPGGGNGAYPYLDLSTAGKLGYYVNSAYRITGTATLVVGTRYRIAISRVAGITRLFVEGVQDGSSYTDGFNYTVGTNRPFIGANASGGGTNSANGKFDEWRVTKHGRYAANYTPLSAEFTNP